MTQFEGTVVPLEDGHEYQLVHDSDECEACREPEHDIVENMGVHGAEWYCRTCNLYLFDAAAAKAHLEERA